MFAQRRLHTSLITVFSSSMGRARANIIFVPRVREYAAAVTTIAAQSPNGEDRAPLEGRGGVIYVNTPAEVVGGIIIVFLSM